MSERKTIFEIAAVYTAVIIGAGFATGRELISFFLNYGEYAVPGLALSGALMAASGWATLEICRRKRLVGYSQLLEYAAGRYVGAVIKAGSAVFLFVIFSAMLSAAGAFGEQLFGLPAIFGAVALCLMCFAALAFDLGGLVRVNTLLAPVMVLGGVGLGLYTYFADAAPAFSAVGKIGDWAGAALVYASYNMITVISVLAAMSAFARTRRSAFFGVVLGAGAVTLIALCLTLGLSRGLDIVREVHIPFLRLVQDYGAALLWVYVIVLAAAVYTTAVTNGYCFYVTALKLLRIKPMPAKAAMCAAALTFSQIEFTKFVENVYPLFGLLGLFLSGILLITILTRAY